MYTFEEYLKDLNEMVKEAVKSGDVCSVNISDMSVEHDDLPYGETTVEGPGYISGLSGEVEFNSEPILTAEEIEEYFDEDFAQAKKFIEQNKENTKYTVSVDLKGSYRDYDDVEVNNIDVEYKFDEKGNVVSKEDSISFEE